MPQTYVWMGAGIRSGQKIRSMTHLHPHTHTGLTQVKSLAKVSENETKKFYKRKCKVICLKENIVTMELVAIGCNY